MVLQCRHPRCYQVGKVMWEGEWVKGIQALFLVLLATTHESVITLQYKVSEQQIMCVLKVKPKLPKISMPTVICSTK